MKHKTNIPTADEALPGRDRAIDLTNEHAVLGTPLKGPFPEGMKQAIFAMGCFWGAERTFWKADGVFSTAVGYAGGYTPNPTYREVCTGRTGHTEVVLVAYDPDQIGYDELLRIFWESHNPTQGMAQGADVGTQYRSAIYWFDQAQRDAAQASKTTYEQELSEAGYDAITTEVAEAPTHYYAEDYHQQYLSKNPGGYCGIGGTGVSCPSGLRTQA
jgi:peptide-methionine (S)-S-oxide reductase